MAQRLTRTQWLICTIAAIGFAFDIYELLMLPLIIKPAIASLSAPLVDELVRGGMSRPDAMAPGARGICALPTPLIPVFAGAVPAPLRLAFAIATRAPARLPLPRGAPRTAWSHP